MRIISGSRKGLKLNPIPKGSKSRPCSDKLKESLFNILTPIKDGARVLDLFAGSGQIGIEFLSRGAGSLILVESNNHMCRLIDRNLEKAAYLDRAKLFRGDYRRFLRKKEETFDYIFMDPPYGFSMESEAIDLINKNNILSDEGLLIIETGEKVNINSYSEELDKILDRLYGQSRLIIYKKTAKR